MNATLNVEDPLVDQEVTILITLGASTQPRDERPALISVGIAGQMPVIKNGVLGDVPALINEAWLAFGVRVQVAETISPSQSPADDPPVATADDAPVPTTSLKPAPRPPQAKNLALF